MKKSLIIGISIMAIIGSLCLMVLCNCSGGSNDSKSECSTETDVEEYGKTEDQPLNISIYLDLSDRLIRDLTPSQMERDTAIINHLVDVFIQNCIDHKIIDSKSHFQIFFYPAPNNSEIAQLAKGLNVDMAKTALRRKKVELKDMKSRFQNNLSQIYNDAIKQKKWVGCDIWGFFSNKVVDTLCVRDGYRNILVILTDGYLFHEANKIVDGKAYSYVLPQTLEVEGSSLITKRNGLTNLEVLMLEVNPYNPKQHNALITILENWFREMGVEKLVVSETDMPVNTEVYIDSFIKN